MIDYLLNADREILITAAFLLFFCLCFALYMLYVTYRNLKEADHENDRLLTEFEQLKNEYTELKSDYRRYLFEGVKERKIPIVKQSPEEFWKIKQ